MIFIILEVYFQFKKFRRFLWCAQSAIFEMRARIRGWMMISILDAGSELSGRGVPCPIPAVSLAQACFLIVARYAHLNALITEVHF